MVPEKWHTTRLADAGILVIDGDRGAAYPGTGELQPNGYCLFLSAKNVTKNGFAFSDNKFISEAKHRELRNLPIQLTQVARRRVDYGGLGWRRRL
jgi:type I restriction enzyme S subunit